MRTVLAIVLLLPFCLIGCNQPKTQTADPAAPTDAANTEAESGDAEEFADNNSVDVDLPECDPSALALDGYKAETQEYADLDGDGTDECVVAYRSAITDELGEPEDVAYFGLFRWDGEEWGEWFSIPAPDGETQVDEDSIIAAEDINGDGVVELVVQMYGFGVSSRPENVYVWKVAANGVEDACEEMPLPLSSDDALVLQDISEDYPVKEIVIAIAKMGDEAHAAPHRYEIQVYGWNDGIYRLATDAMLDGKFASAEDAIDGFVPAGGE